MDREINHIVKSAGSHDELEQLVQRGMQMHNQAVFDLLARLVSDIALIVKRNLGDTVSAQSTADHYHEAYIKQSSRYSV